MSRRLRSFAVLAVAGLLTAGCADDISPAARVGDATITTSAFQAEVEEWAGNPVVLGPDEAQPPAPGAFDGDLVRGLLAQRISFELHDQEFEDQRLTIDDAMREEVIAVVFEDQATADEQLAGFSDEYAAGVLESLARQIGLSERLGEEAYNTWRTEALARDDIEVSPRYGTWDGATGAITAPPGPLPGPVGT